MLMLNTRPNEYVFAYHEYSVNCIMQYSGAFYTIIITLAIVLLHNT